MRNCIESLFTVEIRKWLCEGHQTLQRCFLAVSKKILPSVEKLPFFERKILNSVVYVFSFLKLPMARRLHCRAVSTLINTKVCASPRLGSQRWQARIPLTAIIFTYFEKLVSLFLSFNTKKGFFDKI